MREQFQPIPNPELAQFLAMNPTPSLAYIPDLNRNWYITLYLKDRRDQLLDLVAANPLQATWQVYPEDRNRILRVELFPTEGAPAYWAETEFLHSKAEQVDAFHRLLNQPTLELTLVDDSLYYLGTKLYANDPLKRFRHLAAQFG